MANDVKFKVGSPIAVRYQAPNSATGLHPVMEIYDETGAKDIVNFPDVVMTEIGATGRYVGIFTPDAVGEWLCLMNDGTGKGKMVSAYSVGNYNLQSIGDAMAKDSTVAKDATVAKAADLSALQYGVVIVDGKIDALQADINDLEISSPPQVC